MRAWTCAKSEAIALRALSSSVDQSLIPNLTNPSAPVVTSPESNGTEAREGIVIPLPSATRRW